MSAQTQKLIASGCFNCWLMLDFDGVTHSNFPLTTRPPEERKRWCYISNLETVLRRHPLVGIVVASTHRRDSSLAEMRSRFSPDIRARMVGATPVLDPSPSGPGSRQIEVMAWLTAHHQENTPWLALDDIVDLYSPGACVVEARDGFREQDAAALETALNDLPAWAKAHPVPELEAPRTLWVPGVD
jgi:hypothetical protein